MQPDVPLVRRAGDRRPRLGTDSLHEEPQSAADDRDVAQDDGGDPSASRGGALAVGRAFLGRWHSGQGLCVDEEFPAKAATRPS